MYMEWESEVPGREPDVRVVGIGSTWEGTGCTMYMEWESEVPGREAEGKIAKDAVRSLLELEGEAGEVRQLHGTNKYPCSS